MSAARPGTTRVSRFEASPLIPDMLRIRRAAAADAHRVSAFGRRVFYDTFAAQNAAEDIQAYLEQAFADRIQASELNDPRSITLVAEVNAAFVGYAQLRQGTPPESVAGPEPIELVRFYVDRPWQGRGIAQRLMLAVDEAAAARAATLWLGVWEHNLRAIAFYEKCGFVDVGSHVFQLGSAAQIDRIMVRSLVAPT